MTTETNVPTKLSEAVAAWRALDWKVRQYVAFSHEVWSNDPDFSEADREGFRVAVRILRAIDEEGAS